MILKFDKREFTKSWNKWGLGAWCQTWIRMGILDPKGLITIMLICSIIAGVFYWKGLKNTPAEIGTDLIAYDKTFTLRLDPNEISKFENPGLIKPVNSNRLHYGDWRKDILGNPIKLEDIKELRDKMKPYGFLGHLLSIEGVGSGLNNSGLEAGVGLRYLRLWEVRSEILATNRGGYIGLSYKPGWKFVPNSSLGVGMGKGFRGESRGIIYFSVEL